MNTALPSDTCPPFVPNRTIVLVGMMGAGKSSVGRKLATKLELPFVDADAEVETAAGMTITQLIRDYGEPEFRQLERRVMVRLLNAPIHILSTGGGAFMDADTRDLIRDKGLSIWLKADPEVLIERATRHDTRPLLQNGNPREIMLRLLAEREPTYATADITIESDNRPLDEMVDKLIRTLKKYAEEQPVSAI